MRIYISGKIGEEVISEATRAKFDAASKEIEYRYQYRLLNVIDPASEMYQDNMDRAFELCKRKKNYQDILLYDLYQLRTCDSIYMLEDWVLSNGARVEFDFALAAGKKIYFQSLAQAADFIGKKYDRCPEFCEWNEWLKSKAKEICIPI